MKTILLVLVLGQGADIGTSLATFRAGGYEANPLILSEEPLLFLTQTITFTTLEVILLHRLAESGHPKLAKVLSYIQIGASIGASINNGVVWHRLYHQKHLHAR